MEAAIRAMMEFYKIDREQAIRLMQKSGFQHKDLKTPEQRQPFGYQTALPQGDTELGPEPERDQYGRPTGVGILAGGKTPEITLGDATVTSLGPPAGTVGPQPAQKPEFQPIQESKLDTMMRLAQLATRQQMIPSTLAPPPAPKKKTDKVAKK